MFNRSIFLQLFQEGLYRTDLLNVESFSRILKQWNQHRYAQENYTTLKLAERHDPFKQDSS